MIKRYEHIQIGSLMITVFTIGLIVVSYLMGIYGFNWTALVVLIILGICLPLFAILTVRIDENTLEIRFGASIIRIRISLKDIESCRVVKNPWYYGWGIRLTPHGWLYNVSGFYAVEIKLKSGKKYRIGTDVPNELEKAIQESIKK